MSKVPDPSASSREAPLSAHEGGCQVVLRKFSRVTTNAPRAASPRSHCHRSEILSLNHKILSLQKAEELFRSFPFPSLWFIELITFV